MINTKVIKVSCCGANELLNVENVVDFLESNPQVEIGIGVSRERCSVGMPRFSWILDLQSRLSPEKGMSRIAFHVNGNWSKEIVENGTLPEELFYLLWRNKGIVRIQLNVIGSGHTFDNISVKPLADLITELSEKQIGRFIIPANKESFAFIKKLQTLTDEFDVLYDASFGFGKKAEKYLSLFPQQLQGYAGGLSGDNIQEELLKIDKAQTAPTQIWVDAEGRLKNDNVNTLDLNKAKRFADNAFAMNNELSLSMQQEKSI